MRSENFISGAVTRSRRAFSVRSVSAAVSFIGLPKPSGYFVKGLHQADAPFNFQV